jgi:hypothetical protein
MRFVKIEPKLGFFEFSEYFLVFGEINIVFWSFGGVFEFLDKCVENLFNMLRVDCNSSD